MITEREDWYNYTTKEEDAVIRAVLKLKKLYPKEMKLIENYMVYLAQRRNGKQDCKCQCYMCLRGECCNIYGNY